MGTRTVIDRISPSEPWVIDHVITVEETVLGRPHLLVVRIKRTDLTSIASVKVMTPQLRWTVLVDYPAYKVRELMSPSTNSKSLPEMVTKIEEKLLDDANAMLMVTLKG